MHYDWVTIYQDFEELPLFGDVFSVDYDIQTGQSIRVKQPSINYEGSFSTNAQIRVSNNRLTVSYNPSRYNRLDNLFGFTSLDQVVEVTNQLLDVVSQQYFVEIPHFTKCTRRWHGTPDKSGKIHTFVDGAVFSELHLTTNFATGSADNARHFIRGISTLRYRNSLPTLHPNGNTCDWRSKQGNARLIYACVYNKAGEMELKQRSKVKRRFGKDSPEFQYFSDVLKLCLENGVVRFEQKLKSELLRRENLCFWGLFDEARLREIHEDFLALPSKLEVEAMDLETISQRLVSNGVCTYRQSLTTATYAMLWFSGQTFDLSNRNVQTHRARLRKIGIDIAEVCDLSRHSPVYVADSRKVEIREFIAPDWYRGVSVKPALRLVA